MTRDEFLKLWTAALRSGEYKKTEGTYFDEETNCFCSLGVGAHLLAEEKTHEGIVDAGLSKLIKLFPEVSPGCFNSNGNLWKEITYKNDGGWRSEFPPSTFDEMADFLEEKIIP
jgi:hypothetical protein